jgi:hypothetical protein
MEPTTFIKAPSAASEVGEPEASRSFQSLFQGARQWFEFTTDQVKSTT